MTFLRNPVPARWTIGRRGVLAGLASLAVATPAASSDDGRLLDVGAVPWLGADGRLAYQRFLLSNVPRAFAVASNGRFGEAGDALDGDDAEAQALERCRQAGGSDARLYAVDLAVVWPGLAATPPPPPTRALIETWNYRFQPDPRFLWRGAAAAAGLYVWAHGTSTDPNGLQPPPHVRALNNAGFDLLRFDREPNADAVERARRWLQDGLGTLRRLGYRRLVCGGHSRGAWNCLQMLDTAGLADAVIAISPAANGVGGSVYSSAQTDELRRIVSGVPKTRTTLAFVQLAGDLFVGDPDADARLIGSLQDRLGRLLMIDRPAGFSGHNGARGTDFALAYGDQLLAIARGES